MPMAVYDIFCHLARSGLQHCRRAWFFQLALGLAWYAGPEYHRKDADRVLKRQWFLPRHVLLCVQEL